MKLTHRNQAWKKWYRKSVARWRVTFTFTEKYSRPVTDFMQEWLSFIKGPPGPTVIVNGEPAYGFQPTLLINGQEVPLLNEACADMTIRIQFPLVKKPLGGKHRVRDPYETRRGTRARKTTREIEAYELKHQFTYEG